MNDCSAYHACLLSKNAQPFWSRAFSKRRNLAVNHDPGCPSCGRSDERKGRDIVTGVDNSVHGRNDLRARKRVVHLLHGVQSAQAVCNRKHSGHAVTYRRGEDIGRRGIITPMTAD